MSNLPIACTLSSEALAERRAALLANVRGRCEQAEHMASGVRLRFAPSTDMLQTAAQGPLWLEVSGPPGTADFLSDLLNVG